ncbi:MAG TPA: urea ABC transporter permease subunit UrtC [Opitutaceae bacterium]|jgi:urea transport system permease protein|nr:urea ABC transporter permease subunit UrtC [Opitutaceae bacterium]
MSSPDTGRFLRSRHMEFAVVGVFLALLTVVFPLLNAHGLLSDYMISLWGKYLCYALLALSVDLLWGYTGLLSLGQALFFSLGGYMFGMYLMLLIGPLGSYAKAGQNPAGLPDFMVFLGHTFLPPFWRPFHSFGFAVMMVFALPGLLALVFGFLAFRSRIKGVYFSILTQALTYGAMLLFFQNDFTMGGNNGFTDFKFILGYSLVDKVAGPATMRGLFMVTSVTVLLVSLGCYWLNGTKFGLVRQAIRDGENRVLFSGYATANYKLFVFVAAAMIAAIGGALFVPQAGIINPDQMTPEKSIEAVVWVAVGGRGTLIGPIIGAIGINALRSWATHAYPDSWLIILGALFLGVVLFLPGGVVSLPPKLMELWRRYRKSPDQP